MSLESNKIKNEPHQNGVVFPYCSMSVNLSCKICNFAVKEIHPRSSITRNKTSKSCVHHQDLIHIRSCDSTFNHVMTFGCGMGNQGHLHNSCCCLIFGNVSFCFVCWSFLQVAPRETAQRLSCPQMTIPNGGWECVSILNGKMPAMVAPKDYSTLSYMLPYTVIFTISTQVQDFVSNIHQL